MTTITSVGSKPGRAWGILSLIAVAVPLPFLFVLNILSLVVRNQVGQGTTVEATVYGLIAFGGLFFFPVLFVLATVLAVAAVRRPRPAGKVMGWITIVIVILAIPASWFGYLVWITNSR
ncbi:MAG: hypothetical protein KF761_07180 [Salinibacterium sp.]|nr:hypothetical protein [Salinibacterium sp.]